MCGSASLFLKTAKRENRITVTPADHKECGRAACTDKPSMQSDIRTHMHAHTHTQRYKEDKGSLAT